MKHLTKYFTALAILLASVAAWGQGKVYTKRFKLEDFPKKTTRIVTDGQSMLEIAMQNEAPQDWTLNKHEFCTTAEYETGKTDNKFYYLRLIQDNGIIFMLLEKGGKADDPNSLLRPFEVTRVPIAAADNQDGHEMAFMGAFMTIIQQYVTAAMQSETAAMSGLTHFNASKLDGKTICVDPDRVNNIFQAGVPEMLVGITIVPSEPGKGVDCYRMLISAETHELFYIKKSKFKSEEDAAFSESELKSFEKKNGVVAR